MATKKIDKATSDKIGFITFIVPEFAAAYKMSIPVAFRYLKEYGCNRIYANQGLNNLCVLLKFDSYSSSIGVKQTPQRGFINSTGQRPVEQMPSETIRL
jgi:hypothetical protein